MISFAKPSAEEMVRTQAIDCQNLVDSFLAAPICPSILDLIHSMQQTRASAEEWMNTYPKSNSVQLLNRRSSELKRGPILMTISLKYWILLCPLPEELLDTDIEEYRWKHDEIVKGKNESQKIEEQKQLETTSDSVAWANLASYIHFLPQSGNHFTRNSSFTRVIPASVSGPCPSSSELYWTSQGLGFGSYLGTLTCF